MNILFLDLDGTVRRSCSGKTFINDPKDQELIPGVKEAIAQYSDWLIVGITNQGGVLAGHKSLANCIREQSFTLELIPQMERIYFCPDNGETCYLVSHEEREGYQAYWDCDRLTTTRKYRKPEPGMIEAALESLKSSPEKALFVGDRAEDELAANRADIPFMWAEIWREEKGKR
ncbi:HAD-IIIA family hydrolase [Microcoleus sp. LAD1_D5]|uniref:HAD-IIIA family hydrolase n=1 Tax=Microcoleus sp. LAD1_D5 TaxID=2818813 RepID=UPI002FD663FB